MLKRTSFADSDDIIIVEAPMPTKNVSKDPESVGLSEDELSSPSKSCSGKLSANEIAETVSCFRENLDKSKHMFNALRDIPPHGHEAWKIQYGKTFEIHSFLWKFQQKHRNILTERGNLRRYEIGEVASRIGQLYYQYYLRTSELLYLEEAFNFYHTLRLRNYYKNVESEPTPYLMVKKLRFYARYLLVILQMGKLQLLLEVMKELFHFVAQFSSIYSEEDQEEWALVCSELQSFNQKLTFVKIIGTGTTKQGAVVHLDPKLRLSHDCVPDIWDQLPVKLNIGRVVIMGNSIGQVKFHDLSLDMFRIISCFELEPDEHSDPLSKLVVHKPTSKEPKASPAKVDPVNPIKFLLYQPSIQALLSYLSNSFKDVADKQCLVVYLSGEGNESAETNVDYAFGAGGISTNRRTGTQTGSLPQNGYKKSHIRDANCLYPGDFHSFTRKPLFLIVESNYGLPFLQIPNVFGEPFMCIISPQTLPQAVEDSMENAGGLLTLFLADPLMGFCKVCGLEDISEKSHVTCSVIVKTFFFEAAKFFLKSKALNFDVLGFLSDPFLRLILVKFLFCSYVLRLHRSFKNWTQWPRCVPELPLDLLDNLVLEKMIRDISIELDVQTIFNDSVRV